jgi:septum formation protein
MPTPDFVLASASPARRRLLQGAGIEPIVMPSDFDESQVMTNDATVLVRTLAQGKAQVIAQQMTHRDVLILGCDSVLALNGEIHGKPANEAEAIARWQKMRGQVGELFTGHALIHQRSQKLLIECQVTRVSFADASDREIAAYVATGEPMQCAGCFALEGRGGMLIEKIDGCHSNVIGLSLPLLRKMLRNFDYDIADFWGFR